MSTQTPCKVVPSPRISIWEILDFLKEIHAVPVLAHPMKDLTPAQLEVLLPLAEALRP